MLTPRLLALAPLLATALLLGGCSFLPADRAETPSAPAATPAPASTAVPEDDVTYLDQREALLAAEEVMVDYLQTSDAIRQDGGRGVERLRPLVSDELYAATVAEAESWQQEGLRQNGNRILKGSKLNLSAQFDGYLDVDSNHCISAGDTQFVNAAGDVVEDFDDPSSVIVNAVVSFDRDRNGMVQSLQQVTTVDTCENDAP